MPRFDIEGVWDGVYSYDPDEGLPELPPETRFTLTARAGWFGSFRGTVQDDPDGGVPDPATVRGWRWGLGLTFTKRYPTVFVNYHGRSVPLADSLELEYGMTVDHEVPGLPIFYRGEYDPVDDAVTGTWHYRPERVWVRSRGRWHEMDIPATTGRWTMRRARG